MEVLGNIFSNVFVYQELRTWMTIGELGDIKDKVIQDNQLLLSFLDLHLELFLSHRVDRLVELDGILSQEPLVPGLKETKYTDEQADSDVVEHRLDVTIMRVRVNAERDRDLTRDQHQVRENLHSKNGEELEWK